MRLVGPVANKGFERFNRWFTSRGGVYQTMVVVVALVALEATGIIHDPHGFWILYWLTVYSAVTQPALAAGARVNEAKLETVLHRLNQADETNAALLTAILNELRAGRPDAAG